ncbi:MAG TPA: hypothetical protein VNT81_19100 [Vicinamibacterales bacterium]|nr:hypothetical protein [Vicinamibacterales bacterium]
MQSVVLTLRDLDPQPIVRVKASAFNRWSARLEKHLRTMIDERSIHHKIEARAIGMLHYIDRHCSAGVHEHSRDILAVEAGRFFYMLANLKLKLYDLKSKNDADDDVLMARIRGLRRTIEQGFAIAPLPPRVDRLRAQLEKAVAQKDAVAHVAILKRHNARSARSVTRE